MSTLLIFLVVHVADGWLHRQMNGGLERWTGGLKGWKGISTSMWLDRQRRG